MTERLYYADAYTTQFKAHVLETHPIEGHSGVLLDRTFFYPTSGGQPHDVGTLNGVPVVDVQVTPAGDVLHVLARPLDGQQVVGEIDWARRYDHMQQHSGQHLLSQTFYRLLEMETVSVHFGDALCTLDLDAEAVTPEQLATVEEHANQIVWQNRPIKCFWVSDTELDRVPLRRPPQVSGQIRIVEIEDYDWSACGGTHVRNTGEMGPVALLRTEKIRRQCRVHFICGRRALRDARRRRTILHSAAALLDAHFEQVPELVEKLQAQAREQDRQLHSLQEELLSYRAKALLASARFVDGVRLVTQALPDLDPAALKRLASTLQAESRVVALLCCANGGKGTAIFARSEGVDLNAGQLLRDVLRQFGGGGGGKPDFAQGGGMSVEVLGDVLAHAEERVVEQLL